MKKLLKLLLFKMKYLFTIITVIWAFLSIAQENTDFQMVSEHLLDPNNPDYVDNEIIVKFSDDCDLELNIHKGKLATGNLHFDKLINNYEIESAKKMFPAFKKECSGTYVRIQGKTTRLKDLSKIILIRFKTSVQVKAITAELMTGSCVDYAEPNYLVYSLETYPNDPIYLAGAQWHIDSVNAPKAYDSTTADTSQLIAILDTGIDWDHPDLYENIWYNYSEIAGNGLDDDNNNYIDDTRGWDFVNDDNNPDDDNSHGTHVAGIAAAVTNNSTGVAGIAWNARIMPLKILQSTGYGNSADFASAIYYAYQNGATIINMSLGSYGESLTVKNALEYAYSYSVLVAAAGNNFYNIDLAPVYPACYSFVIGVEATNFYGELASFSNFDLDGPLESIYADLYNYEIRAPGYGIYSTYPKGNYHALTGTSMSTPIVSGAIALIESYFGSISHEELFVRLIQAADNNMLDIYNSMIISPTPELTFLDHLIVDTLGAGDRDNIADAGETVLINFDLKNYGGYADSVWAKLRFNQYEDTTLASIIDSLSYIGDVSAYASLNNDQDPFTIKIDPAVIHNRDIVFECIISCKDSDTVYQQIVINVQNAQELLGVMDTTMVLTPDKLWLVNGSFRIGQNGKLILKPGTNIILNAPVVNWGMVEAEGTKDSMITVYGPSVFDIGYYNLSYVHSLPGETESYVSGSYDNRSKNSSKAQCYVENCIFDGAVNFILHRANCKDCIFKNCGLNNWIVDTLLRCNFYNIGYGLRLIHGYEYVGYCNFSRINNNHLIWGGNQFYKNNFITNLSTLSYICQDGGSYYQIPPQYWGTTDTAIIDDMIWDFKDGNALSAIVLYQPFLSTPSDSAHGFAWEVLINDENPQDNNLDPLGVETAKFDVFFNRPMDTAFDPQLSFGVTAPYNQHIVDDNSSWSADSMIWTAYYDIDLKTGDGINYIRVQDAIDDEGFEIPVEDNKRFSFIIQAAGAQNTVFTAVPGIGRSSLNWQKPSSSDVLGYNMYRSYNITDTTFGDTVLVNDILITDTSYIDYEVIPDTTYQYLYKVVGTDLIESDFSKSVSCTPLPAASGDANCDANINVLDITTIVSYMLNENPQPFLFDAADVNYDGEINVLDIIGCVQIISGKKSVPLSGFVDMSEDVAYYDLEINKIALESEGNLAGLQFEIQNPLPTTNYQLPTLKIFSLQKGFEFAYAPVGDKIIGILYSLSGKTLPAGEIPLFRYEGAESHQFEITDIFGGDLDGDYVPVLKKGEILPQESLPGFELKVQPNPFRESAVISWQLPERAEVALSVYDLNGRKVKSLLNKVQAEGNHSLVWNADKEYLKAGIFILHLEVSLADGEKIVKDEKIVLLHN
ncbi:MAG: S8 family serine peptidase [Bacteroidales bacterium]|nr:S8 family serine peptidase [Bacteroidales bacterium]